MPPSWMVVVGVGRTGVGADVQLELDEIRRVEHGGAPRQELRELSLHVPFGPGRPRAREVFFGG